jgi:DNA-binding response OmpR family regulator
LGYPAIHCADGASAIATFAQRHEEIAFVLLDMILPDMDGKDIYDALKREDPQFKCIVSSGLSMDESIKGLLDQGADDFIHKPFKLAELQEKVEQLVGE